jgi:Uma2 family endonuclease
MIEAGILSEDDRLELIDGDVLEMSPIGSRHASCVKRLNALLTQRFGTKRIVSVQDPIVLGEFSSPQPDVAVLTYRSDYYSDSHPTAADTHLVIEVADTSLEYDRSMKIPLYAAAAIGECWLVDLNDEVVTVYSAPERGAYRTVSRFAGGDRIKSIVVARPALTVNSILR